MVNWSEGGGGGGLGGVRKWKQKAIRGRVSRRKPQTMWRRSSTPPAQKEEKIGGKKIHWSDRWELKQTGVGSAGGERRQVEALKMCDWLIWSNAEPKSTAMRLTAGSLSWSQFFGGTLGATALLRGNDNIWQPLWDRRWDRCDSCGTWSRFLRTLTTSRWALAWQRGLSFTSHRRTMWHRWWFRSLCHADKKAKSCDCSLVCPASAQLQPGIACQSADQIQGQRDHEEGPCPHHHSEQFGMSFHLHSPCMSSRVC